MGTVENEDYAVALSVLVLDAEGPARGCTIEHLIVVT